MNTLTGHTVRALDFASLDEFVSDYAALAISSPTSSTMSQSPEKDYFDRARRHLVHPIRERLPPIERRPTLLMLERGASAQALQGLPSAVLANAADWAEQSDGGDVPRPQLVRDILAARSAAQQTFSTCFAQLVTTLQAVHDKLASTPAFGELTSVQAVAVGQQLIALQALTPVLRHLERQSAYASPGHAGCIQRAKRVVDIAQRSASCTANPSEFGQLAQFLLFQLNSVLSAADALRALTPASNA